MTGDQLKELRTGRGLTRAQMAAELGDCSPSTINKWERGINPVPNWVEEKLLRATKFELPVEDLHLLLDYAREQGITFEEVMAFAVREYLAARRKPAPGKVVQLPTAEPARAAEDQAPYHTGGGGGNDDSPPPSPALKRKHG
jgi:transcriptional regulator with XRE-family HTH domain